MHAMKKHLHVSERPCQYCGLRGNAAQGPVYRQWRSAPMHEECGVIYRAMVHRNVYRLGALPLINL